MVMWMDRTAMDIASSKRIAVAVVDLNSSEYKMDSKSHNRLKWCFENTMKSTFKLHICAIDSGE